MKKDSKTEHAERDANQTGPKETDILPALWQFFSSMKTAIVLLLILAAVSVIGTMIQQGGPADMYSQIYGEKWARILVALRLTNLYHSPGYVILLALVGINLTVCSINRFGAAWRRTFHPKIALSGEQVRKMQRSDRFSAKGDPASAAAALVTALRSHSYHVLSEQVGQETHIHAAKGRLSIWGPYLTHLSILVIFIGAIIGSRLGFHGNVNIAERNSTDRFEMDVNGRQASAGTPLGFTVACEEFRIERDEQGNVKGYKSDLRILERDEQVASKVIDVNHPLTYRGVSFFQSSYGPVYRVIVRDENGVAAQADYFVSARNDVHGPEYSLAGEPFREINVGDKKLTIFLHDLSAVERQDTSGRGADSVPVDFVGQVMINERFPEYSGLDAWKKLGWVGPGGSVEHEGWTVSAETIDYTRLQVSRNPGLPVVYAGFGLILLGVFAAFYLPQRTLRVVVSPSAGGSDVALGASSRAEPSAFDRDFERLREAAREVG